MTKDNIMNATDAYKDLVRRGFKMSYPTLLSMLRKAGIGSQPFGKGVWVIGISDFERWKEKLKKAGDIQ